MRVALMGAGQIAQIHLAQILQQQSASVVGIADADTARAEDLAHGLNGCRHFGEASRMIREVEPDVVHVLTPPEQHACLSIMALNAGCHVLVEKPMAVELADAKEMVEAAKRNNVYLCVNHNVTFERLVRRATQLISSGAIGEVVSAEARQVYDAGRNPALIEQGAEFSHWSYRLNGGPLQELSPHPVSLVSPFLGEFLDVQSAGQNRGLLPRGWDDEVRILIKGSEAMGYVSISLNERPDVFVLTVRGTQGLIEADLFNNLMVVRKQSGLPRAVRRGLAGFQISAQSFKGSVANAYSFARGRIDKSGGIGPVISGFYEAIRKEQEPPIPLAEGLRVVDLINRIWPDRLKEVRVTTPTGVSQAKKEVGRTTLVTGASGFIGYHLVNKLLEEGLEVRALVRPNSIRAGRLKTLDVDIVEGDLRDPGAIAEAVKGAKTVYHAGAATNNDWQDNYQSTIKGSENVLKASMRDGVERLVNLSTIAVYDLLSLKKGAVVTEDSPYLKKTNRMVAYPTAKIEAEKLLLDAHKKHDFGATILRLGLVFGPMGPVFFPHLGYRYQASVFVPIRRGKNVLPLTYIENSIDAIYRASTLEQAIGQTYNIVDDGEVTARDYLNAFLRVTELDARVVSMPYAFAYLLTGAYEAAAALGAVRKGATSREQLKWKLKSVRIDNSKAKSELGWSADIPLEEGMERTFRWYASEFLGK